MSLRRAIDLVALLSLVGLAVGYVLLVAPLQEGWPIPYFAGRFELAAPHSLVWLGLAPLLLPIVSRTLSALPWQQQLLSLAFRTCCIVLLTLGLSQLVVLATTSRVFTVFLVDGSVSVSDAALGEASRQIESARATLSDEDRMAVVRFAGHAERVVWPQSKALPALRLAKNNGEESNLQAALQLSYGLFPQGYLRQVVLISDGQQTRGQLLAEAERAEQLGVKVSTLLHAGPPPAEVAVLDVGLPQSVKVGQAFHVTVQVVSSRATSAVVKLYQGPGLNGLEPQKRVELAAGQTQLKFRSVVRVAGSVSYRAALQALGEDTFAENNQFVRSLKVPGRPLILYVEGQSAHASYFANALGAQQFDVDVRAPSAMPGSLAELSRYDFVVLSDVRAEQVGEDAQLLLERYVRQLGGGLLFAGGEAGFSLGGWQGTTMERLLPVRMDAERRREQPGVAMALVIDRSGSMTGLPLDMAKAACRATVQTLRGSDRLEIIAFDSKPRRFVKMQPARYRQRIEAQIAKIQPGGGTGLFSALDAAYQDLALTEARKKHVILLTDGQAESEGIVDLVEAMIAERITVTTVGLGGNTDADLLRQIARAGGGRFHAVPDPNNLPRIFTRETMMIARNSAVQDWFPVQQSSGADFLAGISIAQAPLLQGYVATQLKAAPAQLILSSDRGEPILARWRLGLGWSLAWTSDLKNGWAAQWLQWRQFGRFWGQLLREHMRANKRRELPMKVRLEGDLAVVSVDAFTAEGAFDSALQSQLVVEGPLPSKANREFAMRPVAPGRYEAKFRLPSYGSFLLSGRHFRQGDQGSDKLVATSTGSLSQPYPTEYAKLGSDATVLRHIAQLTGGRFEPPPNAFFDAGTDSITRRMPLWPWLVLSAMLCMLFDVLMRRVRLFDRGFRRA